MAERLPLPVLAGDYGETARRIADLALSAQRRGAYRAAGALVKALPELFADLATAEEDLRRGDDAD